MIVLQVFSGAGRQAAVAATGRRGHAGLCILDSLHSQHGVVACPAEQYACCQGHLVSGSSLCICFSPDRPVVQGYPDGCQRLLLRLRPVRGHRLLWSLCIPPAVDSAAPICMNSLNRTSCLFGSQLPPQDIKHILIDCLARWLCTLALHRFQALLHIVLPVLEASSIYCAVA